MALESDTKFSVERRRRLTMRIGMSCRRMGRGEVGASAGCGGLKDQRVSVMSLTSAISRANLSICNCTGNGE